MASFVTVSNGLVIRRINPVAGQNPSPPISNDPWIDVTGLINIPNVGDHTPDEGQTFVMDKTTLSTAQGNKLAELRDACANHIKNFGFAVGFGPLPGVLVFGSKPTDQQNIHSAVEASQAESDPDYLSTILCGIAPEVGLQNAYTATDWDWRDFTKPQVLQISSNLHVHIQQAREQIRSMTSDVLNATTVSEVNAVEWIELP